MARALVVVVLAAHYGFLVYVVAGGFLAWWWPAALWPHLVACAWGAVVVAFGPACPLTVAEAWARRLAGEGQLTSGFIDRYVEGVLYPARYTPLVQAAVALVVLVSWLGAYRRRRAYRHRRSAPTG